jgi:hypothetical protein
MNSFEVPSTPARVGRVRTGWPSGPVPWMIRGEGGRAWVWDPPVGLLRVPGLHKKDPEKYLVDESLSIDGRSVEFREWTGPAGTDPRVIDLMTGETRVVPELRRGAMSSYPVGDGRRVLASNHRYGDPITGLYRLERDGDEVPLPIDGRLTAYGRGRRLQFSPTKAEMALTVGGMASEKRPRLLIARVDDGEILHYFDGFGITTTSAWSPDGRRLLVFYLPFDEDVQAPQVLDLETGERTPLTYLFRGWRLFSIAGWIDDHRLLVSSISRDGRIVVSASDTRTGKHHDLVDLPLLVRTDDFHGVLMAPDVVRADPMSLLLREQ